MRPKIDRPHWSHSSLSLYLKCPLQFYFERVLRLPLRTTSDAQVLGASIHAALAFHHRWLQAGEAAPAHQVRDTFLAAWENQANEFEVVYDRRSADDNLALGIALIEVYLGEPPPERIVAVEAPILAPIANSQGHYLERPLAAVLDLVTREEDGSLKVTEIKTTSRAYADSEVASSLQPTCYGNALYEQTGQEPAIEYAVLVKTRTPRLQRIDAPRTASDYGRLGDIIQVVEAAVEAGIFYPIESPMNCSTCPYFRECREWAGPKAPESGELEFVGEHTGGEVALAR